MPTCNDCIHQELCDFYATMGVTDVSADDITACEMFKNKAAVVEVVHGYWIITEEILEIIRECSCCHCKTFYPKPLRFNVRKSPYCEDCGAKMDGDKND